MPANQESINRDLYGILKSRGYRPDMFSSSGKKVSVPDQAEAFQFDFVQDGKSYGKVTATLDGLHRLIIYYGDDVKDSPKADSPDSPSFTSLKKHLKRFAKNHSLGFELSDEDNLEADMAKREYNKTEGLNESYYAMGKMKSYSDNVPTTKILLQHTRVMEEGEQRFRHVAKIFVENINGERFLLPTNKPGIARVYARHIAEGGTPYDERGTHITTIVEEYQKMAGFVRATKGKQFNESAQKVINEGLSHYTKLRETLHKMSGKRGYNEYFQNYTPALMEDESNTDLSEMFMQSSLDPRIENVMPILSKLSKNITETTVNEIDELEEWADSIIEGTINSSVVPSDSVGEDDLEESLRPGEYHHYEDDPVTGKRVYKGIRGDQYQAPTKPHQFPDDKGLAAAQRSYDKQVPEGVVGSSGKFVVTYHNDLSDDTRTVLVTGDDEHDAKDKIRYSLGRGSTIVNVKPARGNEPTDQEYKVFKDPKTGVGNPGIYDREQGVAEAGNKPVDRQFPLGTGDTRTARELKTQMQGASDEFVNRAAKEIGPMHSRVAKMQGKLAKSELRRREQGVAEGLEEQSYFYDFAELYGHPNEASHPDPMQALELVAGQYNDPKTVASNIIKFAKNNPEELRDSAVRNAVHQLTQSLKQGVAEELDNNQKAAGQLGPTEKITKSNPTKGKLVGGESVDPLIRIKGLSGLND